ncbi:MAG TPA: cytochrome P450 [Acidimicrobiia bacterium]|nr:cytochrome P450 [Acidimicrobiia bacterium]
MPTHEPLTDPLVEDTFYAGDPFPQYARLRDEAPVAWNDTAGFWAVSRWEDVMAVSTDPATFCSGRGILVMEIGAHYDTPPTMMHTDPPEHTVYRKLVQPGFAPGRMRVLEDDVRRRAKPLVDRIAAGKTIDFVESVSVPFPLFIISTLLGMPDEDWERFFEWSESVIPGATDWSDEKRAALQADMHATLLATTVERRADPRDDLISVLAQVEIDGRRLNDAELTMFLVQLLVAGNETTRNMISGGIVALAERPTDWQRLLQDRALVPTAVEEMLRWTTPVVSFMRTATRDTELGGQPVRDGDPVLMLYASANRDERQFGPTADRFEIGRSPNQHVAFGFGTHFCIGATLARIEGRVLLEELLDRFETVELAGDVRRSNSAVIAGVKQAPLEFR